MWRRPPQSPELEAPATGLIDDPRMVRCDLAQGVDLVVVLPRDARLRWPNGAQSWPDSHLEFRLVAPNAYRDASVPILPDKAVIRPS